MKTRLNKRVYGHETARVLKYCEAWCVPVVGASPSPTNDDYHDGPTISSGIDWQTRTIFWDPADTQHPDAPGALLHELSHILAGEDPQHVDEAASCMLAFEWFSHRYLKLRTWVNYQRNYQLTHMDEWQYCTNREKHGFIVKSHIEAMKMRILTADGKPTFKRSEG